MLEITEFTTLLVCPDLFVVREQWSKEVKENLSRIAANMLASVIHGSAMVDCSVQRGGTWTRPAAIFGVGLLC
jgi:hypothetical protein